MFVYGFFVINCFVVNLLMLRMIIFDEYKNWKKVWILFVFLSGMSRY